MANKIPSFDLDLNIISGLADIPAEQGIDAAELKGMFDRGPSLLADYINDIIVPAINQLRTGYANEITESTEYPGCFYRMVNGEKAWIEPPMVLNEEYRTCRRWLGKPVYAKLVSIGSMGANDIADLYIPIPPSYTIVETNFHTFASGEASASRGFYPDWVAMDYVEFGEDGSVNETWLYPSTQNGFKDSYLTVYYVKS